MFYRGIVFILLLLLWIPVSTIAADKELASIQVSEVWASPPMGVMVFKNDEYQFSELYLHIENQTDAPIVLTAIETAVSEFTEIRDENGATLEKVEILSGESLALTPQGSRLRLINLLTDFEEEDVFTLTLTFETGKDQLLEIPTAALVSTSPPKTHNFVISNVWARFAPGGSGSVSAVYMNIENQGEEADQLVEITTPVAETVEIHEAGIEGEVMSMSPIATLDLPADQEPVQIDGEPYHIMLIGLTEDLMVGNAIPLTLQFASGETITIAAPILLEAAQQDEEHSH